MRFINGGDLVFDALLYPPMTADCSNYIMNQFTGLSNSLSEVGQQFMNEAYNMYQKINDSTALYIARNALRQANEISYIDIIRPLVTIDDIMHAPLIMQRYIMAEPLVIRKEYLKGRLDGYSETYSDVDPGHIGEDHYDYRRVMDGVLYKDKCGDYIVNDYIEELLEGDRELTHDEQLDILKTWQMARIFAEHYNRDITDPNAV